jgi:LPXTG-motif cell wall-anchored protein
VTVVGTGASDELANAYTVVGPTISAQTFQADEDSTLDGQIVFTGPTPDTDVQLVQSSGDATIHVNLDGSFSYTPNPGFVGTDTFMVVFQGPVVPLPLFVTMTVEVAPVAPAVSAVSPASGPQAGGTSVTISGHAFTTATGVDFGTTPASSFTVNDDGSITAVAPAGTDTVDVTVTTAVGGTSATRAADRFGYAAPVVVPPITTITPSAPALDVPSGLHSGDVYTFTASHLTPGAQVEFVLHSNPIVLGTVTVAADGTATLTTALPAGVSGSHTLEVVEGGVVVASAPVTIAADPATALATTGTDAESGLLAAAALIVAGVIAVVLRRRKSRA